MKVKADSLRPTKYISLKPVYSVKEKKKTTKINNEKGDITLQIPQIFKGHKK